jgi:hypothetical protein
MTRIALCACVLALCGLSSSAHAIAPAPGPAPLRFGGSINAGVGFFYPSSANDFIESVLDSVIRDLEGRTGISIDRPELVPILVNVPIQLTGFVRVGDSFQAEAWWEVAAANGAGWTLDQSYSYSDGYQYVSGREHQKVVFTPSWRAIGANALYLAGGPRSRMRPMAGAGLGYYSGTFRVADSGRSSSGPSWDDEFDYVGNAIGANVILGFSIVASRNLELECRVTGRYANIAELKRGNQVLRDTARGGEKVQMNLSGIDFRFGARVVLP